MKRFSFFCRQEVVSERGTLTRIRQVKSKKVKGRRRKKKDWMTNKKNVWEKRKNNVRHINLLPRKN